ncbi:amino acid--tRNA ligase-related protein [Pseudomonas sp. NPDC087614]|uniref:amino acid--tRNA ligase-related protein n=1 Tax=Pseudomonas sp. NPDC087614 TaxID=3364442 RepID=UPI0037F31A23
MEEITSNFADFANPDIESIAIVRGRVLQALQQYLLERDFKQLMPILMSPITDPLNHAVYPAELQYEERRLKLTASMIFHKQLALTAKGHDKIFIVAPNIRLEKAEIKDSENHLLEFSQFDFEIRDGDMHQVMALIEGLIKHVFAEVTEALRRRTVPTRPPTAAFRHSVPDLQLRRVARRTWRRLREDHVGQSAHAVFRHQLPSRVLRSRNPGQARHVQQL